MSEPMTIDLGDPDFWQDPYPVFKEARARNRIARTNEGEVVLLGADDFDAVHTDPDLGQPGLVALERLDVHDGPFYEWRALAMAAHDGPVHDRLRGTVGRAFSPRRVERVRAGLREHAARLLDEAAGHGTFDVVKDYSDELPLWLVCDFLGLPQSSRDEIGEFLAGTEEGFTDPLTPEKRRHAENGIVALGCFVAGLVAERSAQPAEDLVTDLLEAEAEGRLAREELVALVVNVIGGAVGSSRAAIVNGVLELLRHPDQADWVRADDARVQPAVEECLRYHPPFRSGRKMARVATARFGVELAPGETIFLARQAANRDPERWADPDHFDVSRRPERHYSFGYGAHFCLGQALARLDVQESLRVFLTRLPSARLVTEEPRRVPFTADEQIEELLVAPGGD